MDLGSRHRPAVAVSPAERRARSEASRDVSNNIQIRPPGSFARPARESGPGFTRGYVGDSLVAAVSVREELEERLLLNSGLVRRPSRHGDSHSYFVGTREIAHFHGDGRMDVRLTRQVIGELKQKGTLDRRVQTRGPSADWAKVALDDEADLVLALELVDLALKANR